MSPMARIEATQVAKYQFEDWNVVIRFTSRSRYYARAVKVGWKPRPFASYTSLQSGTGKSRKYRNVDTSGIRFSFFYRKQEDAVTDIEAKIKEANSSENS